MVTKKEIMRKAVEELPDNADFTDGIERLLYLQGIERGLSDVKAGRVTTQEDLLKQIETWQK